jgi:hypothetical protein
MFNPSDMADTAAKLVLVDPQTRSLLQPASMPGSGDIKTLGLQEIEGVILRDHGSGSMMERVSRCDRVYLSFM